MIPRPTSDAAARYDPGRWICNTRPERCSGTFRVYGQDMPCPIRAKCYFGRNNTYEHTPGGKLWGRYPALDVDIARRRQHRTRLKRLRDAFGAARRPESTPESRERAAARARASRAAQRAREASCEPPLRGQPLPCGEDCENCPYPGGACPYTDEMWDAREESARRDKLRQQAREKHARERAKEAADPAYRDHRRELDRRRCKRYYEAHRDVLREKARQRQKSNKGKEDRHEKELCPQRDPGRPDAPGAAQAKPPGTGDQ